MADIIFPDDPELNEFFFSNGKTFTWNGEAWVEFQGGGGGGFGYTGSRGLTGIVASPTPPADTEVLWLDESDPNGTGPSLNFDGGSPSSVFSNGPVFDAGGVT